MRYGYARISSDSQNINLQLEALRKSDCCEIIEETFNGSTIQRPCLDALLQKVTFGDSIIVWKLDRLSRGGLLKTLELLQELSDKGVYVVSLTEGINTCNDNPMAKAFLCLLAVFAELEKSISKERVQAGIESAKKRGVYKGKARIMTRPLYDSIVNYVESGHSIKDACIAFGIARTSYYNAKKYYSDLETIKES